MIDLVAMIVRLIDRRPGGIPAAEVDALGRCWDALPGLREELFEHAGGTTLHLRVGDVEAAVRRNPAVKEYLRCLQPALFRL